MSHQFLHGARSSRRLSHATKIIDNEHETVWQYPDGKLHRRVKRLKRPLRLDSITIEPLLPHEVK